MMRNGEILADGAVDDVFTSENLNQIFGLNANVLLDQRSGRPVCVPMIAN
jgi:iron complex transport system ATP-binding protein